MVKHKLHRSRGSQSTIAFIKITTNISHCTIIIICSSLYQNSYSVRSIPFEKNFFIVSSIFFCSSLNGTFYILFRHIGCPSILYNGSEAGIGLRMRSPFFHCHYYIFSNASKSLCHCCPTLEFSGFSKFKCSSHNSLILFL